MADIIENNEGIKLTQANFEDYTRELAELKNTGRYEMAERIKEAKSFGDLSENAEYDEAMSDQAKLEARIAELENILKNATILDEATQDTKVVSTGLYVKIRNETLDEECVYHIVSAPEADPFNDAISDDSPVGKALLGHKRNEKVTAETLMGTFVIRIRAISKEPITK